MDNLEPRHRDVALLVSDPSIAMFSNAFPTLLPKLMTIAAVGTLTGCMMFAKPPQTSTTRARARVRAAPTARRFARRATRSRRESSSAGRCTLRRQTAHRSTAPTIAVDGGMPQHGHGLPTKPRVTRAARQRRSPRRGNEVQHGRLVGREVPRQRRAGAGLGRVQSQALTSALDRTRAHHVDFQVSSIAHRRRRACPDQRFFALVSCALASTLGMSVRVSPRAAVRRVGRRVSSATLARSHSRASSRSAGSVEPLRATMPRAAALGRELFFDTRLSGNGKVSCATCHVPTQDFQDGKPLADGVGTTARRTMPDRRARRTARGCSGTAAPTVSGRRRSARSRARSSTAATERSTRTSWPTTIAASTRPCSARCRRSPDCRGTPARSRTPRGAPRGGGFRRRAQDEIYARVREHRQGHRGVRAAHRATRRHASTATSTPSWRARAHARESALDATRSPACASSSARRAASTATTGRCSRTTTSTTPACRLSRVSLPPDSGRAVGVRQVVAGEFNCTSRYSDAKPEDCDELRFAVTEGAELVRAYKTPSLRNVADRAPYMHAGQLAVARRCRRALQPPRRARRSATVSSSRCISRPSSSVSSSHSCGRSAVRSPRPPAISSRQHHVAERLHPSHRS